VVKTGIYEVDHTLHTALIILQQKLPKRTNRVHHGTVGTGTYHIYVICSQFLVGQNPSTKIMNLIMV
jgi:hypothetical protein